MTRINAKLPPRILSDEHLIAEQKEIWRLPLLWKLKYHNGSLKDAPIPREFTLGEGHLFFFLDKGRFIRERTHLLQAEIKARRILYMKNKPGIQALNLWEKKGWYLPWEDDPIRDKQANLRVVQRILEKMSFKRENNPSYGLCFYGVKELPAKTIDRLLEYTLDK